MAFDKNFLAGIIEGFYGQPWSHTERFELFDRMASWGLNTYFYAPKDDLKHRALWRQPYSRSELNSIGELIRGCRRRNLNFVYGLSPGLDIRYSSRTDLAHVRRRFEQMLALGCRNFSLLFDDIPDRLEQKDLKRWGSLASAQSNIANVLFKWMRNKFGYARLLFCPTPYCGRMAMRKHGGEGYLSTIGQELLPDIDVFWTGPEIISREITVNHITELRRLLGRKPIIWDNLHANDYDGHRFFCGPYSGRPPGLKTSVRGILCNPNNEFPLNFVPIRTFAEFIHCEGSWNPRKAYLSAMQEWLPHFATIGRPPTSEDLLLLGDCYYLPHEAGPEAEALYELAKALVKSRPQVRTRKVAVFKQRASRLRDFCFGMTELTNRPLFYALSRRVWELREELDLLLRYVSSKFESTRLHTPFASDSQLPGTFRGGMVARLQRLLIQKPDGTFTMS